MTVVIDASVWLDAVTGRLPTGSLPTAPRRFSTAEVLSGPRGLVRGGHLEAQVAVRQVRTLERAPLLRVPVAELLSTAWPLSAAVSAYDACYVALAAREDAELHTADARLARGAAGLCAVRLLAHGT